MIVIVLMCFVPTMFDVIVKTEVEASIQDFGFGMIDNSTNENYTPFNPWFSKLYHLFNS